jgi:hypothetical protein
MADDTTEGTLIDVMRHGTWPAEKVVVGSIKISGAQVTVRDEAGREVVEISGECMPGDLAVGQPYKCSAEANRIRWTFNGALTGAPTAGSLRGRQFFHKVTVRSISAVIAHRMRGS